MDKKILVVDDEKNFLWIFKQSLVTAGFSVVTAENGEAGVAEAQKENPDLILLDILMPGIDGIETAKRIKALGIKSPIMFLTNLKDEEHISKAIELGTSDYILKSDMHIDDVVARIKEKLGA
jgi:two-component system alkaline phosphatase synthesis response regulator PhoP